MTQLPAEHRDDDAADLEPLHVIRTETVLSRLPIHHLSKHGRVDIYIKKKNDHGKVIFGWKVSENRAVGAPRQLAYKIDTLVVNRRFDELERPLPKRVRLGGLSDIAKELGVNPADTQRIKKAIKQNVGVQIEAKLTYKGRDGRERELDAVFHRYDAIFTRQKLPDGERADAVYLDLSDTFLAVLNSAPDRPLDYDYLADLTPAAQRFYEIVSFKIFTSLKYKHPHAQILYSEYCMFSAQQRYYDTDHFKKQMYKVHRPHLKSGYLKSARYNSTVDGDGRPDWILYYTPGPKAKAEYKAFNHKENGLTDGNTEQEANPAATDLDTSQSKNGHSGEPEELVQYFHHVFHGATTAHPSKKILAQAHNLIEQYGIERARHIVEYAHRAAAETKYQPQTFSGILHYATPALAAYEENRQRQHADTAIAQCQHCDSAGYIHFKQADGDIFSSRCPHDLQKIEAREKRDGLTRIS
jgi:hypothetical protein